MDKSLLEELSDQQSEMIVGGVGRGNAAIVPWGALGTPPQDFDLHRLDVPAAVVADISNVRVPSAVPVSGL